jgi:hypothetical protein
VGFSGVRYCSDGHGIDGRLWHLVRVRRDTRAAAGSTLGFLDVLQAALPDPR